MSHLFSILLFLTLALPAFGQREQLVGTWEHRDTTDPNMPLDGHVQFLDNGDFTLDIDAKMSGQSLLAGQDSTGVDSTAAFVQILTQAFADSLVFTVHITGVWAVDGSALHLDAQASEIEVNGLPMQEFLTQLAKEMAKNMAVLLEIPEADYPAFEEQLIAQMNEGNNDEFAQEFSPDDADLDGTYTLADGVLYITDEEGETTDWHNSTVNAVSVVETLSWGQLKAAGR